MLLRILAFLFDWELVWLIDFDGKRYLTRAYDTVFNLAEKYAWFYPFTRRGFVLLRDDGYCTGICTFIKTWEWARQSKLRRTITRFSEMIDS